MKKIPLCSNCKNKPRRRLKYGGGYFSWCADCIKSKYAGYRATYLADPVKKERNSRAHKLWAQQNPEAYKLSHHEAFMKLKREMLRAYGPECSCCGEDREVFLTLEHLNGDGSEHRKRVGGGTNTYRDLKRRGWPQGGYTVLCMNCNWATRFGGVCPHQLEREHNDNSRPNSMSSGRGLPASK
jgi:hypothetical protein